MKTKFRILIFSFLFSTAHLISSAQFEKELVVKQCKDCYWEGKEYKKPKGQMIYMIPGRQINLYSFLNNDKIKNLYAVASKDGSDNIDWLIDKNTNEILIDVRKWNGTIKLVNVQQKNTSGSGGKCLKEYWLIIYDGGSIVLDFDFNKLLSFEKGKPYEFHGYASLVEFMKDENDWAIKNPNNNDVFDLNGKKQGGYKVTAKLDLGNGIILGTDNKLYKNDKVIKTNYGDETTYLNLTENNIIFYKEINRLIVKKSPETGNLIDLDNLVDIGSFYFLETDKSGEKYIPTLRNGKYFMIKPSNETMGILNAETGTYCNEGLKEMIFTKDAFYVKGNTGDYSLLVDPATCKTENKGIKNDIYSALDINITQAQYSYTGMATCLTDEGKILTVERGFDGKLHLNKFNYPNSNDYIESSINDIDFINRIIPLKNGGYAACGRNKLMMMDKTFKVFNSIGSKLLDWRAQCINPDNNNLVMDDWKCNSGSATGTIVDFLDVAENSSGSEISSVFLYHVWSNGSQKMYLGIAVKKTAEPYHLKLYDTGIEVPNGAITSTIEAVINANIIYLSETEVLLSFGSDGFQQTVISTDLINQDKPLVAKLWQGNLFELENFKAGGITKNNNGIYCAGSGESKESNFLVIGKIKWNNNQITLENKNYLNFGSTQASVGEPHVISFVNNESIIIAGKSSSEHTTYSGYPYFIEFDTKSFTFKDEHAFILKGDNLYDPRIADIVPFDGKTGKKGFVSLYRGNPKDKIWYYLTEFSFEK